MAMVLRARNPAAHVPVGLRRLPGRGTGALFAGLTNEMNPICEAAMSRCETCGNDYDKAFQVVMNGVTHTFHSFECAIQGVAPTCPTCGTHIVGHGVEKDGTIFCCVHCAKTEGATELRDRA